MSLVNLLISGVGRSIVELQEKGGYNMATTLYEQALKAGLEINNHESDLHIKYTPEARKLVNEYKQYKHSCFIGADGQLWIEVPFAFEPFWETKRKARGNQA